MLYYNSAHINYIQQNLILKGSLAAKKFNCTCFLSLLPINMVFLKDLQKDYSRAFLHSLSLPPHHEGLALRVNAVCEVKVHGGQHPVEEVHDPNQTGLV